MAPRPVALAAAILGLAGCARGTGVVPVAPGVFASSAMRAPVLGGGQAAERDVLATAQGFCAGQGRVPAFLDLRPGGDPFTPYWPTAFNATFRCVAAGPGAAGSAAAPTR